MRDVIIETQASGRISMCQGSNQTQGLKIQSGQLGLSLGHPLCRSISSTRLVTNSTADRVSFALAFCLYTTMFLSKSLQALDELRPGNNTCCTHQRWLIPNLSLGGLSSTQGDRSCTISNHRAVCTSSFHDLQGYEDLLRKQAT